MFRAAVLVLGTLLLLVFVLADERPARRPAPFVPAETEAPIVVSRPVPP